MEGLRRAVGKRNAPLFLSTVNDVDLTIEQKEEVIRVILGNTRLENFAHFESVLEQKCYASFMSMQRKYWRKCKRRELQIRKVGYLLELCVRLH